MIAFLAAVVSLPVFAFAVEAGTPVPMATPAKVDVTMTLSSSKILLGEPVWVDETIHNTLPVMASMDALSYCFDAIPIRAEVPGAAPGDGHNEPCRYGIPGGSCTVEPRFDLAPDASDTHRFLLEGPFHFAHPGTYRVVLHVRVRTRLDSNITNPSDEQVTQEVPLTVLPATPASLLARERALAVVVDSLSKAPFDFPEANALEQLTYGLSLFPAAGMEPIYAGWVNARTVFSMSGITALEKLDTPQARAMLAEFATRVSAPDEGTERQWRATEALIVSGDRSYLPLLRKLRDSPIAEVRQTAIHGMGLLGGEDELGRLGDIVKNGNDRDRDDAVFAIGTSDSRKAVQMLIDVMAGTKSAAATNTESELTTLTHYELPSVSYTRTNRQSADEWQRWWDANARTAPIYSIYECRPGSHYEP